MAIEDVLRDCGFTSFDFAVSAEDAGFRAVMCSDHLAPWSERQGHSGFAWSWLGAAMEAGELTVNLSPLTTLAVRAAQCTEEGVTVADQYHELGLEDALLSKDVDEAMLIRGGAEQLRRLVSALQMGVPQERDALSDGRRL